jgi:ubiquinone/menaquinone biosynthesis C-methylase UbiE
MAEKGVKAPRLILFPRSHYADVAADDPLRLYFWPIIGRLFRRRVELCLAECPGGLRVLEVGCGAGVTFLNLHKSYREIYGLDLTMRVDEVAATFENLKIPVHLKNGSILQMPYAEDFFDTVLAISVLEHLKPEEQPQAFEEIHRVLRPGGQVVYGVPVARPLMTTMFHLLGYLLHYEIEEHHFSTEKDVAQAAGKRFQLVRLTRMRTWLGPVYEVGHFLKKA